MKARSVFIAVLIAVLWAGSSLHAQTARPSATITLLPLDTGKAASSDGLLIQGNPPAEVTLQFDLSALPPDLRDADFIRCTLRLVAKTVKANLGQKFTGAAQVIVKGRTGASGTPSIVSLSVVTEKQPVALQTSEPEKRPEGSPAGEPQPKDALRQAVFSSYRSRDKLFSIVLFTETHKASSIFHSKKSAGDLSSYKPRLVIEYKQPAPSLADTLSWAQHQHDPEHTGRTPWAPFVLPTGFTINKVDLPAISGGVGTVADYPLIYRGSLYLVVNNKDGNRLLCLDFTGKNKVWDQAIGTGAVERSPVISPSGIMYVVTKDKITGYDLNLQGKEVGSYALAGKKLTAYSDLTVGNDGSVFLAVDENSNNYILGLTAKLVPFIRSALFKNRISTVTASASGNKVFAETSTGAVVADIANPVDASLKFDTLEYYHVPVAGPAGGVMLLSDFTGKANKANVWGYAARQIWNATGTLVPQPALGSNGLLYYIQDGKLQRHEYNTREPAKTGPVDGLQTTSNLVMDGANNVYFWNNGAVQAYKPDGTPVFTPASPASSAMKDRLGEGPEKFLRLMLAPDGTLWVNNKNGNELYALKPSYAQPDLTVKPGDIRTQTVYRATGTLKVDNNVIVPAADGQSPMRVLFEAQNSISFAPGFGVQQGASVLCRTGF